MNSLKKLKRAVKELEMAYKPHPEFLYPGDFVRCKVDGEVYIVVAPYNTKTHNFYWDLISLYDGIGVNWLNDWEQTESGEQIRRDIFWDDTDPDWEVLNIYDKEGDNGH